MTFSSYHFQVILYMEPSISYQAHCQNIGWQQPVTNGIAGTTGRSLRLEALKIHLHNAGEASLSFDIHLQDDGWIFDLSENDIIGTTGQSKRLEAIVIRSNGLHEQGYRIQYKVHVQDIGWQYWVNEGEIAGTTGRKKRIEAIEIKVIKDDPVRIQSLTINSTTNQYTNYNMQVCVRNEESGSTQNFRKSIQYQQKY